MFFCGDDVLWSLLQARGMCWNKTSQHACRAMKRNSLTDVRNVRKPLVLISRFVAQMEHCGGGSWWAQWRYYYCADTVRWVAETVRSGLRSCGALIVESAWVHWDTVRLRKRRCGRRWCCVGAQALTLWCKFVKVDIMHELISPVRAQSACKIVPWRLMWLQ